MFALLAPPSLAIEPMCPGGTAPNPGVIWCDDFENSIAIASKYFDYDNDGGDFVRVNGVGVDGSAGMRAVWQAGEDSAGQFKRMFGRNPVNSQSHSTQDFRDIYWRQYVRTGPGWTGNPYKLSRATVFAASSWAQGMIAHVWGDGVGDTLMIDPATGVNGNGQLATTRYNDFANLQWQGYRRGTTPIFSAASANRWFCVEAHAKLNTAGASNGTFELWIDDVLQARRADLNWVDTWDGYGINAVMFENYWNDGAPGPRERFIDNIVIATNRIGCMGAVPQAPRGLRIVP